MILPINQLDKIPFCVTDASAVLRKPPYRQIVNNGRKCNGLIYVISGECEFLFRGTSFRMRPGAVAYIPLGSVHIFNILSDDFTMYRINFSICSDGKPVFFSDCPILVSANAPEEFVATAEDMSKGLREKDYLYETEMLCRLLGSLAVDRAEHPSRIEPARKHIREHLFDTPDITALARLCYLGRSQFCALFRQETGCSPLEYRATLIMRQADILLSAGDMTVTEVAHSLGFQDAAYFSRFYKSRAGFPPSELLQKSKGQE